MSGYDVLERLRAHAELRDTPILALSALSSPSARVRGLRDGADDYMTKSFLPEELVARAGTLVTRRPLERRTGEIRALAQVAQADLSAPDAEALLASMVRIVADVFGADAGGHPARRRGPGPAPGPGRDRLRGPAGDAQRAAGRAAPLIMRGHDLGVLEVGRRTRRIDARAQRLLLIVADRVAAALEHARLEGEARDLADVVRRIGEGVIVTDADDRVLLANRAFHAMVGGGEDLTGQRWTDFLSSAQQGWWRTSPRSWTCCGRCSPTPATT